MDDLVCPVCHEARAPFRVYACGHSVCTECMRQSDEVDSRASPAAPHRCPLCRAETRTPWHQRPWNRALNAHLRLKQDDEEPLDVQDDDDLDDLCARATLQRIALCEAILPTLLQELRKAAGTGEALVSFQDAALVDGVRKIRSIIAEKLFRHGIYRMEICDEEFIVSLIPELPGNLRKRVFTNPDFVPSV